MTASYPTSVASIQRKVDLQDLVVAADINRAYDEIEAIQTTLGASPATTWGSVGGRLDNIETVLGTTITSSSSSITSGYGYHRITASTSAPGSGDGSNGDIWIQYV